jgi:hypothetical protein
MAGLAAAFWSPAIWLPPNITWQDFEGRPEAAQFHHLLLPFPLALLLILARLLLEHSVFRPLGRYLGIKDPARWVGPVWALHASNDLRRALEKQPVLEAAWGCRGAGAWDEARLSRWRVHIVVILASGTLA